MQRQHGIAMRDGIVVDYYFPGIKPLGNVVLAQKPLQLIAGLAFGVAVVRERYFHCHASGRLTGNHQGEHGKQGGDASNHRLIIDDFAFDSYNALCGFELPGKLKISANPMS